MKTILLFALFSVVSCQAKDKPVEVKAAPAAESSAATPKAEEDCDDKAAAAKKVEIKEEGISLTNNSAGCTLE
jgi:hypothetical protein